MLEDLIMVIVEEMAFVFRRCAKLWLLGLIVSAAVIIPLYLVVPTPSTVRELVGGMLILVLVVLVYRRLGMGFLSGRSPLEKWVDHRTHKV
jgi:hypothetical protein